MANLPHHYAVTATARSAGVVNLRSQGLVPITSAPPAEFGGPGDQWSPESLLVAAVADCFILTFKAIAKASKMEWDSISCIADGTLDRVDKAMQFTQFCLQVTLTTPPGSDEKKGIHILEKAKQDCLITNSLSSKVHLEAEVQTAT